MKKVECLETINGDQLEFDDLEELAYKQQDKLEVTLYRSPDGQLFLDAPGAWYLVDPSEIVNDNYAQVVIDYMDGLVA